MLIIVITGICLGCMYALIAAGYTLVFRTTGIVHFAQGAYAMVTPMVCSWLITNKGMAYPLAAVVGVAASIGASLVLWTFVTVPMWKRGASNGAIVVSTLVMAYALSNVILLWQGPNPQTLRAISPHFTIPIGQSRLDSGYVWVVVGMLVILLLLGLYLQRTALGRSARAVASNREVSELLGISPNIVGAYATTIAAVMGGIAGLLLTPVRFTAYDSALLLGTYGFVAAILGGFGTFSGAVFGGVTVGVLQQLVSRYISSSMSDAIVFSLLLVFLVVRPQGILGHRGIARRSRGRRAGGGAPAPPEPSVQPEPPVSPAVTAAIDSTSISPAAAGLEAG